MVFIIAWRNLFRNKKRTLFFGLSLFAACFFFLAGKALGNASSIQALDRFRNIQSGDIAVAWQSIDRLSEDDPGRLLLSEIDIANDAENRRAMDAVNGFLAEHKKDVRETFMPLRATGMLATLSSGSGSYASYACAWGVTREELEHFFRTAVLVMREGAPLFDYDHSAYISEETAREAGLDIGDWFMFDSPTVYGPVNSVNFQVTGIYAGGAPWDDIYVYTPIAYARQLLAVEPAYWSSMRIYLNDPTDGVLPGGGHDKAGLAETLAKELSDIQRDNNLVIRVQTFEKASAFWGTFGSLQKEIVMYFSAFLLLIIGMGIRASVRMNVFQRMNETGILAAMGFSRPGIFFIIALETIILSFVALAAAIVAAFLVLPIAGYYGVYAGGFGFEYITGSMYLYPSLESADILFPVTALALFSLFAPLKPALRVLMLRIPELLARNPRPIFASVEALKKLYSGKKRRRKQPRINADEHRHIKRMQQCKYLLAWCVRKLGNRFRKNS